MARKMGIETEKKEKTDNLAVVKRLILDAPILRRGLDTKKLNCTRLTENHIMEEFRQKMDTMEMATPLPGHQHVL
jgi:hypothetical protein